jgi:hypothetical protein
MKKILKFGVLFFVLATSVVGASVYAAVTTLSDTASVSAKSITAVSATSRTTNPVTSQATSQVIGTNVQTIKADNVSEGTFGANTGGGNYVFSGGVSAYNFDAKGGMTLGTQGLPTSIAFTYADNAPAIRVEAGSFKFIKSSLYLFDNNVQTTGSVRANDYIAGNGSLGVNKTVTVKGSNNQNCSLTFSDGLLTATTCPATNNTVNTTTNTTRPARK